MGLDDPNGIWRPRTGSIASIGLALEPWPGMTEWIERERLDALFVHRPWGLPECLPGAPGVLAYHLAFDERLTVGFNPRLAAQLEMKRIATLGEKQGRPIGMIGDVPEVRAAEFRRLLEQTFADAVDLLDDKGRTVRRIAIVGAMWPELVRSAAVRGADLYVTGTLRGRALEAVEVTGLALAIVGHRAPERWGLRALRGVLTNAFPELRVVEHAGTGDNADTVGARSPLAGRGEGGFADG